MIGGVIPHMIPCLSGVPLPYKQAINCCLLPITSTQKKSFHASFICKNNFSGQVLSAYFLFGEILILIWCLAFDINVALYLSIMVMDTLLQCQRKLYYKIIIIKDALHVFFFYRRQVRMNWWSHFSTSCKI